MPHFCEWPLDTYTYTWAAVLSAISAQVQQCEKLWIWQPRAWTSILTFLLNKTPQWRATRRKYQHPCTSLWLTSCSFTTCVTNKWFKYFPVNIRHKTDLWTQPFTWEMYSAVIIHSNPYINCIIKIHPSHLQHFNTVSCFMLYSSRIWQSAINS